MATNVGTLTATIEADVTGLRSGGDQAIAILTSIDSSIKQLVKDTGPSFVAIGKQMDALAKSMNSSLASMTSAISNLKASTATNMKTVVKEVSAVKPATVQAEKAIEHFSGTTTKETSAAAKSVSSLDNVFGQLKATVLGFIAVQTVTDVLKAYINTADEISLLNSRLKISADSQKEFNTAQTELLKISNETRTALGDTATLYTRLDGATQQLGTSQKELFGIVETVNKSVIVSGATATEASNALTQFSQGIASGALRGEELNSVLEQTPRLAQLIADGMGVTRGSLKKLAEEGKLTSETVIKAIQSQSSVIDKEFSKISTTVGQATTVATNNLKTLIGAADEAAGISKSLSSAILTVADALASMDPATVGNAIATLISTVEHGAEIFAAYAVAAYGPKIIAGATTFITSTTASIAAQLQMNSAVAAGTAVMLGSTEALQARAAFELEAAAVTAEATSATLAKAQADVAAAEAQVTATSAEVRRTEALVAQGQILSSNSSLTIQHAAAVTAAAEAEAALATATVAATEAQVAATGAAGAHARAQAAVATAASASTVALGFLATAANSLLLIFVGYQIADYFEENFDFAKRFFIGFADVAVKVWYSVELTFKAGVATLEALWDSLMSGIKKTYASFLSVYAAGMEALTGTTDAALRQTIAALNEAAASSASLGDRLGAIGDEFKGKFEAHNKQIQAMYEAVGKTSKATEEFTKKTKTNTAAVQAGSKAAEENAKRLQDLYAAMQQLLDRLLPLQELNRQYTDDLAMLDLALATATISAQDHATALDNLNKEYRASRQAIADNNVEEVREQYRKLGEEYERQIEAQKQLRAAYLLQIETQQSAIDTAEQLGEISGVEAAQERIELLQEELNLHKQIYDEIEGSSPEAQSLRAEELQSIQDINGAIREQQQLISDSTWVGGAKKAWKEWADDATNAGLQAQEVVTNALNNMEDALVDFVKTGKLNFEDFANAVLEDLLRIQIRAIMVQAISGASGLFFHDGMEPTYTPPRLHTGLQAGKVPGTSAVKLHNGLKPDEFSAILQVGERVTSKRDVESQNREMQQYEQWKLSNGGQQSGGNVSVSVPVSINGDATNQMSAAIQKAVEGAVLKTLKGYM